MILLDSRQGPRAARLENDYGSRRFGAAFAAEVAGSRGVALAAEGSGSATAA